jgi:sterol desaturase/sphingolipid hydroxylase (fatty acid hydroxylase superfamily)
VLIFWGVPAFGRNYWQIINDSLRDNDISYYTFFVVVHVMEHNFIHVFGNLMFYILYRNEFEVFERYKTNSEPWPWKVDADKWRQLVNKSMLWCFINGNITFVAFFLWNVYTEQAKPYSMRDEDLPTTLTLVATIVLFMIIEDAAFYFAHRLLHVPLFYKHIHK